MRQRHIKATVGLACLAIFLAPSGPAGAHSDDGLIEIESVSPTGPLTVRVETTITFVGDGHAAPAATATVVAERSGAPTIGPVVMTIAAAGSYGATITLPTAGEWTLRVSSLSPTASVERIEVIAAPSSSTTTTAPTATTTSNASPTATPTTAISSTNVGAAIGASSASSDPPGKNKVATTLVFVGVMVAIATVAVLAVLSSRQARRGQSPR